LTGEILLDITKGLFLQLVNRSNSRIIFSAATDELTPEAFQRLWNCVGESIFKGLKRDVEASNYYELRVDPIFGDPSGQTTLK
jgi:hypothetical protein